MSKDFIIADYYAETHDEKTKGKVAIKKDTITAAYSISGYRNRVLVMTDGGLKFAVKGSLKSFDMFKSSTELLKESSKG